MNLNPSTLRHTLLTLSGLLLATLLFSAPAVAADASAAVDRAETPAAATENLCQPAGLGGALSSAPPILNWCDGPPTSVCRQAGCKCAKRFDSANGCMDWDLLCARPAAGGMGGVFNHSSPFVSSTPPTINWCDGAPPKSCQSTDCKCKKFWDKKRKCQDWTQICRRTKGSA